MEKAFCKMQSPELLWETLCRQAVTLDASRARQKGEQREPRLTAQVLGNRYYVLILCVI